MRILAFLPVIVSSLLAGAHFYRSGSPLFVVSLLLPFLMIVGRRFVPRLITLALLLFAAEWLRTLYVLSGTYQEAGLPATRLTVILASVSLVTLLSPLVFTTAPMRRRFGQK